MKPSDSCGSPRYETPSIGRPMAVVLNVEGNCPMIGTQTTRVQPILCNPCLHVFIA